MGFLADLAAGFAQLIADDADGAQNIAWQADGTPYDTGNTGIYRRKLPAAPNRAVALTAYGLGDDPVHSDSDFGLQVITRSEGEDPTDADDLDDAIADVLLGRYPFTLSNGIRVETLARSSGTSLGQDDNRRWSLASNYTVKAHRPGPHRL